MGDNNTNNTNKGTELNDEEDTEKKDIWGMR